MAKNSKTRESGTSKYQNMRKQERTSPICGQISQTRERIIQLMAKNNKTGERTDSTDDQKSYKNKKKKFQLMVQNGKTR